MRLLLFFVLIFSSLFSYSQEETDNASWKESYIRLHSSIGGQYYIDEFKDLYPSAGIGYFQYLPSNIMWGIDLNYGIAASPKYQIIDKNYRIYHHYAAIRISASYNFVIDSNSGTEAYAGLAGIYTRSFPRFFTQDDFGTDRDPEYTADSKAIFSVYGGVQYPLADWLWVFGEVSYNYYYGTVGFFIGL